MVRRITALLLCLYSIQALVEVGRGEEISSLSEEDKQSHSEILEFVELPYRHGALSAGGWCGVLTSADDQEAAQVFVSGPYQSETGVVLQIYRKEGQDFTNIGSHPLDHPARFAAPVEYDGKLFLIGGFWEGEASRVVTELEWNGHALTQTRLADLPHGVGAAEAAVVKDKLYVVGGAKDLEFTEGSLDFFQLDMKDPAVGWQLLEPFPGGARIMPIVFGLYGQLNVIGGFKPATKTGKLLEPTSSNWIYRERPVDGLLEVGWQTKAPLPISLAGAAVFITGQAHAVLLGGFSNPVKVSSVLDGTFSPSSLTDQTWLTHVITDTWMPMAKLNQPTPPGRVLVLGEESIWFDLTAQTKPQRVLVPRTTKSLSVLDYTVIAIYFAIMALVGVWFARKQDSSEEFSLGGRKVKWWAGGISMFATGASSISFMAIPAIAFSSSLVWLTPIVVFMIPAYFMQAYIIYPLLRQLNLTSTFEFLEQRYNTPLRLIASFQAITFQLFGRMGIVLLLPALAISAVTGLSVFYSVLLMGLLTTLYTTFGGFEAVIWTDVIQGGLMILGCTIMIGMAVVALPGGASDVYTTLAEQNKLVLAIWEFDWVMPFFWISALAFIIQQLTFAADQPVVQRVYATPLKDVRKLAGMGAVCGVLVAVLVNFTGLALYAYFKAYPAELDPGMTLDQVVPLYVVQRLPIGLSGLIVAAIFAASMSTLSSSMNSVAILISEDFYRRFYPEASDRSRLRLMMAMTLSTGLIGTGAALYMASIETTSMFEAWSTVYALLGGGFLGIYILGIFTTRTNSAGAITGAVASVIATTLIYNSDSVHWVFFTPFAVCVCVFVGYLSSFVLPGKPRDLTGLTAFTRVRAKAL